MPPRTNTPRRTCHLMPKGTARLSMVRPGYGLGSYSRVSLGMEWGGRGCLANGPLRARPVTHATSTVGRTQLRFICCVIASVAPSLHTPALLVIVDLMHMSIWLRSVPCVYLLL